MCRGGGGDGITRLTTTILCNIFSLKKKIILLTIAEKSHLRNVDKKNKKSWPIYFLEAGWSKYIRIFSTPKPGSEL